MKPPRPSWDFTMDPEIHLESFRYLDALWCLVPVSAQQLPCVGMLVFFPWYFNQETTGNTHTHTEGWVGCIIYIIDIILKNTSCLHALSVYLQNRGSAWLKRRRRKVACWSWLRHVKAVSGLPWCMSFGWAPTLEILPGVRSTSIWQEKRCLQALAQCPFERCKDGGHMVDYIRM